MKVNRQWVPCVRNSSFSFIPVILKLYGCLDLALKMHMSIEYTNKIILSFFSQFDLVRFSGIYTECIVDTLYAQILVFYVDSFKTLQMLWTDVIDKV